MGSSMGFWEVMLAMSKAQKTKRDEQAAATKSAWELSKDKQQLEIDRQRVEVANRAYTDTKPQTPEAVALARAKALLEGQKAASYQASEAARIAALDAGTAEKRQRVGSNAELQPGKVKRQAVDITGRELSNRLGEAKANNYQDLTDAQIAALEARAQRTAAGPSASGGGRSTLPMHPAVLLTYNRLAGKHKELTERRKTLDSFRREKPYDWNRNAAIYQAEDLELKSEADKIYQKMIDLETGIATQQAGGAKPMPTPAPPDDRTTAEPGSANVVTLDQPGAPGDVASDWFTKFNALASRLPPDALERFREQALKDLNGWSGDFAKWDEPSRARLLKMMRGNR